MSPNIEAPVEHALAEAASAVGLRIDPNFVDTELSTVAGPFVTMNIADAENNVVACVALRDTLSPDDGLLETLASAVAAAVGSSQKPTAAGPVGTGADLPIRFATPISAVALTDGAEIQALLVTGVERRSDVDATKPPTADASPAIRPEHVGAGPGPGDPVAGTFSGLDKLVNVALDVSVELGRASVTLAEVLEYDVGSVIELDRAAGAPVDVRVNGMLLAQGEVVLIDDEYAVRITAIFDPQADR